MEIGNRIDYFRKEHQDFVRFLDDWDLALSLIAGDDRRQNLQGLNRLRALEPGLQAIQSHCASEERTVEEPFHAYLQKGQMEALQAEHEELTRLLGSLFTELRFATLSQTSRALSAGRRVSEFTRRHIQFEEQLLAEIEQKLAQQAEQRVLLRYTQSPE